MKTLNKIVDWMIDHEIFLFGTYATGCLLWLVENKLKSID